LGKMGYKLETTALISIDNYNAFRIRCIMLILEIINSIEPLVFSSNVVKGKYCERIRII
jgi:hypothetical protein